MPWKQSSVMDERLRFLARVLDGEPMTEGCRDFRYLPQDRVQDLRPWNTAWKRSATARAGRYRRAIVPIGLGQKSLQLQTRNDQSSKPGAKRLSLTTLTGPARLRITADAQLNF